MPRLNLRIKPKLVAGFLLVGLIPAVAIGAIALTEARSALEEDAFATLQGLRDTKAHEIESFFAGSEEDLRSVVETVRIFQQNAQARLAALQAAKRSEVEAYFDEVRRDAESLARLNEVRDLLGGTEGRVAAPLAGSARSDADAALQAFAGTEGYRDLLVIDADRGRVLFSANRPALSGRSLSAGALAGAGPARAWQRVMETGEPHLADFAPYAPGDGVQAAFIAAPVMLAGEIAGVVALELSADPLNAIVQRRDGMGESGETYLVGRTADRIALRSDLVTMGDGAYVVGFDGIVTPYMERALDGEDASAVLTDSAGRLVLVDYEPLDIAGLTWAIISKMNLEEAIATRLAGQEGDFFGHFIEEHGYYDLFLIHPEGEVFYTVSREADFGTNMLTGPYADSGLGTALRGALDSGRLVLADFAPYAPSDGAPAAFIAMPLMHHGQVELVVALQLSITEINEVMLQRAGLGETGETYLVGPDRLMRSDAHGDPTNRTVAASFANPDRGTVDTDSVAAALAEETGSDLVTNYAGHRVLSAYAPLHVGDMTWALVAEIREAEAFAAVTDLQGLMAILAAIGIPAVAGFGFWLARSVANPVVGMTGAMRILAGGDKTAAIPSQDRVDEIGEMAKAVQVFKDNMIRNDELAEEARKEQEERSRRAQQIESLTTAFDSDVSGMLGSVTSATTQLEATADSLSATAEEATQQVSVVAAASEQSAANVQTVAASAEELTTSIQEIGRQVVRQAELAASAVEEADSSNAKVQELAGAARQIGEVVSLITSIAEQTNLLALNATIEAARAGDAGKGFAVVASEVKNLANQTAKATGEISAQIAAIQGSTDETVEAIERIGRQIRDMNEIASSVAAGMEEQNAATQEIARNVQEAAAGSAQVTDNVGHVREAAGTTGQSASSVREASGELSRQAESLKGVVERFLGDVRSA
ncbi:MAG: HAMP domain-containing protein [Alphaproteobacteria bacterium]|jgi:methyl-accepting chemotaxis protein|nr:HAMP domain-containing protein [Alphaproteobacteria bacterium]